MRPPPPSRWPGRIVAALAAALVLGLGYAMAMAGQAAAAAAVVALGLLVVTVYASKLSLAWKYLLPGVLGMLVFVAFPLAYTVHIGFTNYSSAHLLSEAQVREYLLEQTEVDEATLHGYTMHRDGGALVLALAAPGGGPGYVSAPLPAQSGPVALREGPPPATAALPMREVIAERERLASLELRRPDGMVLRYAGLREFGVVKPLWQARPDGSLEQTADGSVWTPDRDRGYYASAAGETLQPGFTVGIGWANYQRMLGDPDVRGPFISIFVWTVAFAALTVLFSTAIGMALAVLLNWEALKHRTLYRTLLFLPYAVPGFISILVFKGLFNQNFGEINAILDAVFGIRPAWFADPWLARTMILIVNTWLGYPYVMVLCSGLLKSIPADLYEASALAGAGPLVNFFRITAPLVARPLAPLLISAFAFNFNNFVLIALLTDGRPDYLNTKLPAGTTDILVSYTYRIAFTDSGQNFGLAAAISTLIFVMVALMSVVQLRAMRKSGN
ncbi:MAG: maltose ABC transporter permease MalF [Rubrivivax sp.]|nr:maltose ABC transporter permease MalF [Rubrivivax sp.]